MEGDQELGELFFNHKKEVHIVIVFKYLPTLAVHILVLGMEMCMCNLLVVCSV